MLLAPRRVSRMIYGILLNQQPTMEKIESGEIMGRNIINMAMINQTSPQSMPIVLQAQLSEVNLVEGKQSAQLITKPTKLLPRTAGFELWGFSAQLVTLPKNKSRSYRAAVHISLLGRIYSVQLRISSPDLLSSFSCMLHVRNIVPTDSKMAVACRTGDFDSARKLLTSGSARGSDITASGWPILDVSTQCAS